MLAKLSNRPVIVAGMHRSGTTMLVGVMENLGVFMGTDQEVNKESKFFLELNDWIGVQNRHFWDRPNVRESNHECLDSKKLVVQQLRSVLKLKLYVKYLGLKNIITFGGDVKKWGWKDPRNTLTLEHWLELYPDAQIIIVERNGLDVANSLFVRKKKYIKLDEKKMYWKKYLNAIRYKKYPYGSTPINDLDSFVTLWYEYFMAGRKIQAKHGDRCLCIQYEKFLHDPKTEIDRLAKFLNTPSLSTGEMQTVINGLDSSRANSSNEVIKNGLSDDAKAMLEEYEQS